MKPPKVTIPSGASDAEKQARERVAEIKSFYSHLTVFVLVHLMMVGIYMLSGGGHFWPLYSLFGWGIGLASHAASTFGIFGLYDKSWEERKVRELILQQEHGLNADEVRSLLKREMATNRSLLPSADEMRRIRERLENLEAIVTSRDWDELPSHSGVLLEDSDLTRKDAGHDPVAGSERNRSAGRDPTADAVPDQSAEPNQSSASDQSDADRDPTADAARLAKRVR